MSRPDVERFDAWAPSYDESWVQRVFGPLHQATLDYVVRLSGSPSTVLDLGCGTGALLRAAAHRFPGARLVGADPAAEMVRIAQHSALNGARFVAAAADRLPFRSGSFDLVLATMAFSFWPQASGLREVARVLADDGTLVVADLFAVGWLRPVAPVVGPRDRIRTRREMVALLAAAGLRPLGWRAVWRRGPIPVLHAVAAVRAHRQPGAVAAENQHCGW